MLLHENITLLAATCRIAAIWQADEYHVSTGKIWIASHVMTYLTVVRAAELAE